MSLACEETLKTDVKASIAEVGLPAITGAFFVVECKRRSGDFEGASSILSIIESSGLVNDKSLMTIINRHKNLIELRDSSLLPYNEISPLDSVHENDNSSSVIEKNNSVSSFFVLGWNFARAMARHAASGFTRCTEQQIESRLAICKSCENLVNDHCRLCGCACKAENQLINKLALVSEKCPIGKWK